MTFAEAVRRIMDRKGIGQKELSERSGLTPPYISKLLSGKVKEPTWTKACMIIDALEVGVDEFSSFQDSE